MHSSSIVSLLNSSLSDQGSSSISSSLSNTSSSLSSSPILSSDNRNPEYYAIQGIAILVLLSGAITAVTATILILYKNSIKKFLSNHCPTCLTGLTCPTFFAKNRRDLTVSEGTPLVVLSEEDTQINSESVNEKTPLNPHS